MINLFLLTAVLCGAAHAQPAPVAFEFKDAPQYNGRTVQQFRAIDFQQKAARPLLEERAFGRGVSHSVVPVGPNRDTALALVWLPQSSAKAELWVDANGDRKLSDDERHVMTGRELEVPVAITIEQEPQPQKVQRTLVFRRSTVSDGLRYAVRGYMQGNLELNGKKHPVLLIDGNADGCFDTIGQDRVWIDLDLNGKFDPISEQFPLGKPISYQGEVYVVRANPAATEVVANLRSVGQGKLRLTLAAQAKGSAKISAELVSDLGELVTIDKLDEFTPVPFGDYHLSALKIEARAADGQTWTYRFYSEKRKQFAVPTGKETTIPLLDQLAMQVTLRDNEQAVKPGQTISIEPKVTAQPALCMSRCWVGDPTNQSSRAEGNAEVLLLSAAGKTITQGATGFS